VALGRREVGVPHRALDREDVDAGLRQEASVRVSEIVEPQRSETRGLACPLESCYQGALVERPAPPVAEDELAGSGEVAALPEPGKRMGGLRDQRHVPPSAALRARGPRIG